MAKAVLKTTATEVSVAAFLAAVPACLYLKRLDKIDMEALEGLVRLSWEAVNERWPG